MISAESNQSSRWPRDSTSCTQAIADGERQEADPVERHRPAGRSGGRVSRRPTNDSKPDRHDHVERPAPAVDLRQHAAERRADHRADHHRHAEDRGDQPLLPPGKLSSRMVCDSGITGAPGAPCRMRQNTSAPANWPRRTERWRRRTGQHRPGHRLAPAEARHQPAGHRRHHRGREDVEGHRPGDLVLGRRHRALHLRQQRRGDQQRGGIERRAQHDRDHDQHPAAERIGFGWG